MATTDLTAAITTDDPQIPLDTERAIGITRRNTTPGVDPYDQVEWEVRDAVIPGKSGPAFEQREVEFPVFWSATATNIVAQKYFRGPLGSPPCFLACSSSTFCPIASFPLSRNRPCSSWDSPRARSCGPWASGSLRRLRRVL